MRLKAVRPCRYPTEVNLGRLLRDTATVGAASTNSPGTAPEPAENGRGDVVWPIPVWTIGPLAVLLVLVFAVAFGWSSVLIVLVPFAALAATITVIDLRELRIPNRLLAPAAVVAPVLVWMAARGGGDLSFVRSLGAAAALGGAYLLLALIYPPGMGFGDVKFAPLIGALLGLFSWAAVVRGAVFAFLLVGPVALVMLVTGRARRSSGLPFAPFMILGAVIALVLEAVQMGTVLL